VSTHEITANDCTWAERHFESPKEAGKYAAMLEREFENPATTAERKAAIESELDDLFAVLFDNESFGCFY
jgi:hypothetical protein